MGNTLSSEDDHVKQNVYDEKFEVKPLMLLKTELQMELGFIKNPKLLYRSKGKGGDVPHLII